MSEHALPVKPGRLLSLDVFRGATIAAMLLVNNAGDWGNTFPPLLHADWHGCTFTDLIFPFFLFIMGVAMSFSFARRAGDGSDKKEIYFQIMKRTVLLYILGSIIVFFASRGLGQSFKPYGVLQRIAFCYLVASLIILHTGIRGQIFWTIFLLGIHYVILKLVPFPGHKAGSLEIFANISDWLDTKLFGIHLGDYNKDLQMGHDAEGLLGTLSAIGSTLSGVLCGHFLRKKDKGDYEKVSAMAVVGTGLLSLGLIWRYDIPFNKNLWTPSYVVYTTGWALLCLGVCYWLVDIKGSKSWIKPFLYYGMNPITAYFGASIMAYATVWIRWQDTLGKRVYLKYFLYDHIYKSWVPYIFGNTVSSACWGMTYVILWCAVMWMLYKRKIFIKV
jgi:predicted acyltransferase